MKLSSFTLSGFSILISLQTMYIWIAQIRLVQFGSDIAFPVFALVDSFHNPHLSHRQFAINPNAFPSICAQKIALNVFCLFVRFVFLQNPQENLINKYRLHFYF